MRVRIKSGWPFSRRRRLEVVRLRLGREMAKSFVWGIRWVLERMGEGCSEVGEASVLWIVERGAGGSRYEVCLERLGVWIWGTLSVARIFLW